MLSSCSTPVARSILILRSFRCPACTRTILAKSEIVLWRRANEQFHVEVWRSFVPYLTGFLAAVEKEFLR